MSKLVSVMGIAFLALLVFVGLVHVLLRVQEKDSPETLTSLHAMPLIGGFFFPEEQVTLVPTADELRELRTEATLQRELERMELPEGYTIEELDSLTHELADAETANDQLRLELEQAREQLDAEKRDLAAEQQRMKELSEALVARAAGLQAAQDEIEQKALLIRNEELKNLTTVRKMYEKMDPAKAAKIFEELSDVDYVAKVMSGMSERSSAKILQEMSTVKAVLITQRIAAITSDPDSADNP